MFVIRLVKLLATPFFVIRVLDKPKLPNPAT